MNQDSYKDSSSMASALVVINLSTSHPTFGSFYDTALPKMVTHTLKTIQVNSFWWARHLYWQCETLLYIDDWPLFNQ